MPHMGCGTALGRTNIRRHQEPMSAPPAYSAFKVSSETQLLFTGALDSLRRPWLFHIPLRSAERPAVHCTVTFNTTLCVRVAEPDVTVPVTVSE